MEQLNRADEALTNLPEINEGVDSAVEAARAAINSARAQLTERMEEEKASLEAS